MNGKQRRLARLPASLRGRLLAWLLPAACVIGVLASAGTYWGALRELDDLLDDQMRSLSKQIQVDATGKLSIASRDKSSTHHSLDYDPDDVLLQVWRDGRLEFTTDPATHLPPPERTGFVQLDTSGQRWHTFTRESAGTAIRVAQQRQARWEAIAGIAVHLLWPVLSLLPLLALGLWFGIGYGLRPLGAIAAGLKRRHATHLEQLDITTVPAEAKPLAAAINDLLARLDRSFTLQRHFIADAAHELRTPIMGLSIQTQLLGRAASADEHARIAAQIQAGVSRLAHLAEQLLTLARLEPEAPAASFADVDLVALGRSVVAERARGERAARRPRHGRRRGARACARQRRHAAGATQQSRRQRNPLRGRRRARRCRRVCRRRLRRRRARSARQRPRHCRSGSAASLGALLSGRRRAARLDVGQRTRAVDRQAHRRTARCGGIARKRRERTRIDGQGTVSGPANVLTALGDTCTRQFRHLFWLQ